MKLTRVNPKNGKNGVTLYQIEQYDLYEYIDWDNLGGVMGKIIAYYNIELLRRGISERL